MKFRMSVGALFLVFYLTCPALKASEVCFQDVCRFKLVIRETKSMMYRDSSASKGRVNVYKVNIEDDGQLKLQTDPYSFHDSVVPNKTVPVDGVHTVDGTRRTIITINDMFPGPTLEVKEGAEVVVTVVNELLKESLTIHWHGVHMRNNPWMDGVPFVTQCPILSKQCFQYRFIADPPGTHWYHSHFEMQRSDGLYGALIIHRAVPTVPYFTMVLSDWFPKTTTHMEISNPFKVRGTEGDGEGFYSFEKRSFMFDGSEEIPLRYWSGLINGKGRHGNNSAPLSVFTVKPGQRYHVNLVHAGLGYTYRFSIDQHELTVNESDGHRVKPVEIESAIIFTGERYVIEFTANQKPGRYWIRATNLRTGKGKNPVPDGIVFDALAILQYGNTSNGGDPTSQGRQCTKIQPCKVLNCPWRSYHKVWYPNLECIPVSDLRLDPTFYDSDKLPNTKDDEVLEIFMNFKFPASINNMGMKSPRTPFFQKPSTWDVTSCARSCKEKGCSCTQVVNLPTNRTVQVVLTSYSNIMSTHPVHFHGHSFQVLKIGYPEQNATTGRIIAPNSDIVCENAACSRQHWSAGMPKGLNFDNPPLKDTVIVPAYGYTVVRFKTDNPGYWLVHCHVGNHNSEGMALIMNESFTTLPSPPSHFPTCNDFSINHDEFQAMLARNKQCATGSCPSQKKQEGDDNKFTNHFSDRIWAFILLSLCAVMCATLSIIGNIVCLWIICVRNRRRPINKTKSRNTIEPICNNYMTTSSPD